MNHHLNGALEPEGVEDSSPTINRRSSASPLCTADRATPFALKRSVESLTWEQMKVFVGRCDRSYASLWFFRGFEAVQKLRMGGKALQGPDDVSRTEASPHQPAVSRGQLFFGLEQIGRRGIAILFPDVRFD